MRRSRYLFTFFLAFVIAIASRIGGSLAGDAVPALLWGDSVSTNTETTAVNPFQKTSSKEFSETLHCILKSQPPVLVLLKDNLCVEDFTQHKEQFQQATSGGSYRFLPAVVHPLSAIKDLPLYNQTSTEDADTDSIPDGQLVIKPVANLDSIFGLYNAIKNSSPNLVVVLTGKSCNYRRLERTKRDTTLTDGASTVPSIWAKEKYILFYTGEPLVLKMATNTYNLNQPVETTDHRSNNDGDSIMLHLQFGGTSADRLVPRVNIEFNFLQKTAGYYTLETVKVEDVPAKTSAVLTTAAEVVFPTNFSYHCSHEIVFDNASTTSILKIVDVQLQINPDGFDDDAVFSDAYDCVGFTTIPIWTGIFVTAILAAIMIWALTMIMDIRTMDRFDDPKGKTITISAAQE